MMSESDGSVDIPILKLRATVVLAKNEPIHTVSAYVAMNYEH